MGTSHGGPRKCIQFKYFLLRYFDTYCLFANGEEQWGLAPWEGIDLNWKHEGDFVQTH